VAFLIPGGYLLTCAHVIAGLLGAPPDRPLPDGAAVSLDFPLAAGRPRHTARVVFSSPVAKDNTGDVAVLRLDGAGPDDRAGPDDVAPVRLLDTDDAAGHTWRALGFPQYRDRGAGKDAGIWASGRVEGREGTGWWQLSCEPGTGFALAEGFSGAPVWDDELRGVIGLVVAVESDPRRRTGYALTVGSVLDAWPELRAALLAGCPYRELSPFTENDVAVFFGRELETARLAEHVEVARAAIVPVLGASGVGKSSLVSAGLVARLRDTGRYLVARVPQRVTDTAEELVAWALASTGEPEPDEAAWYRRWRTLTELLSAEGGLGVAADRLLAAQRRERLLLVVDQFEVLLAAAPETARRLDTLLAALTARRGDGTRPAQAIVVIRIDMLRQLDALPNLWAAWTATHVVVPPLTRGQLREVIERPLAGLRGVGFAPGLVDQVLDDTPTGAAALPLLEYTLAKLWEAQRHGQITVAMYRDLGGVGGALSRTAEAALWSWADETERAILERVFIQLVRPGEWLDAGERGPETRRIADRTEFDHRAWALIGRLASTRLVVVTRQLTGVETVELAHEALVGSWPRLAGWVEANRDFRTWQESIRRAQRDWLRHGRARDRLLDGARLAESAGWLRSRAAELAPVELEFLQASKEAWTRRRRQRRTRYTAAGLVAAIAVASAGVAVQQYVSAGPARSANLSRQTVALATSLDASQPNLAKQLRVAAYRIAPTPEAYSALATGLPLAGTVAAPGATRLAAGTDVLAIAAGTSVRLWSRTRHADVASLPVPGSATAVAWRPGTRTLAVGMTDGSIRLWDLATPDRPAALATLTGAHGPVEQVAFSPDAAVLASAGWDHTVRLWSVADAGHPAPLAVRDGGPDTIADVAFSPDGHLLASAGWDRAVRLWDLSVPADPRQVARIDLPTIPRSVAFRPAGGVPGAGRVLAAGADDYAVRLWDVTRPDQPAALATVSMGEADNGRTQTPVAAIAFSPDGSLLAATSTSAGSTDLWSVTDPARPASLLALASGSAAVTFTPDGGVLATLDRAGHLARAANDEVQLWDVGNPANPSARATLVRPGVGVDFFALLADGHAMAVASSHTIRLWDLTDPAHPRAGTLLSAGSGPLATAGPLLAVGADNRVTLWSVADPSRPYRLSDIPLGRPGNQETYIAVGLSPDAKLLAAVGDNDNTLRLYGLADPARPALLSTRADVPTGVSSGLLSFGPAGRTLTVTQDYWTDGGISRTSIWDLREPGDPVPATALMAALGQPTATALDPVAPRLAASATDGTVTLWDIADPARPMRIGTTSGGSAANSLRFSTDGRMLAGADLAGRFHLWDLADPTRPGPIGAFALPGRDPIQPVNGVVDIGTPQAGGGRLVVGAGFTGLAHVWNTDASDTIGRLCAGTGDPITPAQWHQYLPNLSYAPPC
jgi:WD40 repeat protein